MEGKEIDKQEVGQGVAGTDRGIGVGGNVDSLGAVGVVEAEQGDVGVLGGWRWARGSQGRQRL